MSLRELRDELRAVADPEKAVFYPRYFKTGPGEYGEADKFLGITVPNQRQVAKKHRSLPLKDIESLIASPWHEERLTGLFILVAAYKNADTKGKQEIYDFYLSHTKFINNWDLVDSSAGYIVGPQLENRPDKMAVLTNLAKSDLLWERRISMLATFHYIVNRHRADEALQIAEILINDKHDLIHKAVGWMLREVGKRCGDDVLKDFLAKHYQIMPRTMLRYAIEKFPPETRVKYLKGQI